MRRRDCDTWSLLLRESFGRGITLRCPYCNPTECDIFGDGRGENTCYMLFSLSFVCNPHLNRSLKRLYRNELKIRNDQELICCNGCEKAYHADCLGIDTNALHDI
ncbi:hypothetical protein ACHAW6_002693 [Cyclotella cf. meneghiniana]